VESRSCFGALDASMGRDPGSRNMVRQRELRSRAKRLHGADPRMRQPNRTARWCPGQTSLHGAAIRGSRNHKDRVDRGGRGCASMGPRSEDRGNRGCRSVGLLHCAKWGRDRGFRKLGSGDVSVLKMLQWGRDRGSRKN
jgi:hypothetical protein